MKSRVVKFLSLKLDFTSDLEVKLSEKWFWLIFIVKQGKPTRKELMGLGRDIGNKWRILGGCLEVEEELDSIDHGYKNLTQKGFQMLKYWTQKNGSSATYRVLSGALEDELLARKDLSQKYCYGWQLTQQCFSCLLTLISWGMSSFSICSVFLIFGLHMLLSWKGLKICANLWQLSSQPKQLLKGQSNVTTN